MLFCCRCGYKNWFHEFCGGRVDLLDGWKSGAFKENVYAWRYPRYYLLPDKLTEHLGDDLWFGP